VNLKRHVVRKNGKQHVYYSLSETIRINKNRTVQRRVLNLGELNTTQTEQWQRSIEVIEAEGQSRQHRLFTDREGRAPADAADACEVILSSLSVRRPREFGACWLGSRLWQELGLDEFFSAVLHDRRGSVEWAKVIELLAVNRLVAPESELGVHQRWYATTAMDVVLGTDDAVAAKDRLYRALDKALEHKEALERHLAQRWQDLFGAKCDLLLYDLTSTDFEGQAGEIPAARRGYSRDSRPDALQLILAMVVTEEGLPLSYEVFEGNRADVTTLEEILDSVERKHGKLGRVWVFDRGIVSEENLNLLRSRGASYLVATPKRLLTQFHKDLLAKDWTGYLNLCRLVTDAHIDGYYYKPRIDREHLARHSEGLIGLSACLNGEVARALEVDDWDGARRLAGEYGEIFGKDGFFLELQDHGLPEQRRLNEQLVRLAPEVGLPLVVTNDLHYVHQGQSEAHDVLLCVGTGNNLDTPGRLKFETHDFWLKSAAQMAESSYGSKPNRWLLIIQCYGQKLRRSSVLHSR